MYPSVTAFVVLTGSALTHAVTDHWCGDWAGSPNPANMPDAQQLPNQRDLEKRFFVEPQLAKFAPAPPNIQKVQIPKMWGNDDFRLALMSYATSEPAPRIYSSCKSRWSDVYDALDRLLNTCVLKGTGGAYLVPPSPGLKQSTLVLYAYAVGSRFDFQMNYYMTTPYGIDPSTLASGVSAPRIPTSFAFDLNETALAAPAAAPVAPAGYSYLGCYTDPPERTLSAFNTTLEDNTPQKCAQQCPDSEYFGLEFGSECRCDRVLHPNAVKTGGGCYMPCPGDEKQMCGDEWLVSVYKKETATA